MKLLTKFNLILLAIFGAAVWSSRSWPIAFSSATPGERSSPKRNS